MIRAFPPPDVDTPDEAPSKSQRKREMHALQALGERLVEAPPSMLAAMDLPEPRCDAIARPLCNRAHDGRRRQMQLIGRLMRSVDAEAIRARLELDDARHRTQTAIMHAAERWRDALLAAPDRLSEFVDRHPGAAGRDAHPALRAALAEAARGRRGRHHRELYRVLRDALLAHTEPPPGPNDDA
jgi:ribosome-associated protein